MPSRSKTRQNAYDPAAYQYLHINITNRNLYDLKDANFRPVYERQLKLSYGETYGHEIRSALQINSAVSDHINNYGNRSLIVASGSANVLWLSTKNIEPNYDCVYVPAPPITIDSNTASSDKDVTQHSISVQVRSDINAVKHMGYKNIEEFMYREIKARTIGNIMIGEEKIDIPQLYDPQKSDHLYLVLRTFLGPYRPSSILYLYEGPDAELPKRTRFIDEAKKLKIPIVSKRFGIRDTNETDRRTKSRSDAEPDSAHFKLE